jgi:hypothetical protein
MLVYFTCGDFMIDFVITIISSAGVSLFLVWLLREWISTRLKASIQHEYDQKIELYRTQLKYANEVAFLELKMSLEREVALRTVAHASFSEGQKASMERKLDSIDMLWGNVVMLDSAIPPLMHLVDVMTVEEYEKNIETSHDFQQMYNTLPDAINKLSKMDRELDGRDPTEKVRPYVGEYTWALFVAYYAIVIRAVVGLLTGKNASSKIEWFKNKGTRQIIEQVLSQDEIKEFDSQDFGKFGWIHRKLEDKILGALAKVISGENFGVESLAQAKLIQQVIDKEKIQQSSHQ